MCYSNCPYEDRDGECRSRKSPFNSNAHCNIDYQEHMEEEQDAKN